MSKRDLKKYLHTLPKEQLEEQVMDLYSRFKPVKTYYDFVFNPDEALLLEEAKFKIGKEYFPQGRRKAKMRRSIAQKYIRHFITLNVEPTIIAEVMVFNLEKAQALCKLKPVKQESFYISMLRSFREAMDFVRKHGLMMQFTDRLAKISKETDDQNWFNKETFLDLFPPHQSISGE